MDKNVIDGSYTRYTMPSVNGLAQDLENGNVTKETVITNSTTNKLSETYVLGHNTVK